MCCRQRSGPERADCLEVCMQSEYLAAAYPEPVTLLGQKLEKFSLGHFKLLTKLESPFLLGGSPQLFDLLLGVLVCSQPAAAAEHTVYFGLTVPRWHRLSNRTYRLAEIIEAWRKSIGAFDWEAKAVEFVRYLRAGSNCPKMHEPEASARRPGAPFVERVQIILQGRLGYTISEALNCPWGEALHHYFAFWEMEGAVKLFNPDDEEHMRAVRELMAEIQAEAKAKEETEKKVPPCQN